MMKPTLLSLLSLTLSGVNALYGCGIESGDVTAGMNFKYFAYPAGITETDPKYFEADYKSQMVINNGGGVHDNSFSLTTDNTMFGVIPQNYILEFTGYFKPKSSGIFTVVLDNIADNALLFLGDAAFNCGDENALNENDASYLLFGSTPDNTNTKTYVNLDAGVYYPLRIVTAANGSFGSLNYFFIDPKGNSITDLSDYIFSGENQRAGVSSIIADQKIFGVNPGVSTSYITTTNYNGKTLRLATEYEVIKPSITFSIHGSEQSEYIKTFDETTTTIVVDVIVDPSVADIVRARGNVSNSGNVSNAPTTSTTSTDIPLSHTAETTTSTESTSTETPKSETAETTTSSTPTLTTESSETTKANVSQSITPAPVTTSNTIPDDLSPSNVYVWTDSTSSTISLFYYNDAISVPSGGLFKRDTITSVDVAVLIPTPSVIGWDESTTGTTTVTMTELLYDGTFKTITVEILETPNFKPSSAPISKAVSFTSSTTKSKASSAVSSNVDILPIPSINASKPISRTNTRTVSGSTVSSVAKVSGTVVPVSNKASASNIINTDTTTTIASGVFVGTVSDTIYGQNQYIAHTSTVITSEGVVYTAPLDIAYVLCTGKCELTTIVKDQVMTTTAPYTYTTYVPGHTIHVTETTLLEVQPSMALNADGVFHTTWTTVTKVVPCDVTQSVAGGNQTIASMAETVITTEVTITTTVRIQPMETSSSSAIQSGDQSGTDLAFNNASKATFSLLGPIIALVAFLL